jgi:hypothetical protein
MSAAFDRRIYARQILLPEIGEEGQRRLCATRMRPTGDAVADDYLRRAGCALVADGEPVAAEVLSTVPELDALASDEVLREAAAALRGALLAVETIKHTLGVGRPLRWPDDVRLDAGGCVRRGPMAAEEVGP